MIGYTTIGPACTLGEGPLWHPEREQLFWFDIPHGVLHSSDELGHSLRSWAFGEPVSAAGWVDINTLVIATASGLVRFDIETNDRELLVEMEAGNPVTRSNDGRTAPDGSFWIGTMGRAHEPMHGTYYRFRQGRLLPLFDKVSTPNATCFAPDGGMAYLADTVEQVIWRWKLDGHGNPDGERSVHIDLREENINPDGAVCDSEGYLWNAQWGASRLACYAPDGSEDHVIELPVSQPTCPAFGGKDLRTLYVTSAMEELPADVLSAQPEAGKVIAFDVDVSGIPEFRLRL